MTGDDVTVTIRLATAHCTDGCAVVAIGREGTSVVVADGIDVGTAVKIAYRVRSFLDADGHLAEVSRSLEDGEAQP